MNLNPRWGQRWALPWPERTPGPRVSVALLAGSSHSGSGDHCGVLSTASGGPHTGQPEPAARWLCCAAPRWPDRA